MRVAFRIRTLAVDCRYTSASFAKALELPTSSANNYWSGKRPWPLEALPRIADLLSTNIDALVRGPGASRIVAASDERALLDAYSLLSARERSAILLMIQALVGKANDIDESGQRAQEPQHTLHTPRLPYRTEDE